MSERWTPVYDRLFDPEHDLAGGTACRRWAWIDLCHMAQWRDGAKVIGGTVINLKRGELLASIRYLGDRWGWSKDKVRRFLDVLTNEHINKIETVRATPFGTVYRVVSYDVYANPQTPNGTPKQTETGRRRDGDGTGTGRGRDEEQQVVPSNNSVSTARAQGPANVGGHSQIAESTPGATDLVQWLGKYENGVVARFLSADEANPRAVRSIAATYASNSMAGEHIWGSTPDDERKIVLADALETLAGEGERYKANFFRRIIKDRLAEGIGGGRKVGQDETTDDEARPLSPDEMGEYLAIRSRLVEAGMKLEEAAEEATQRVIKNGAAAA